MKDERNFFRVHLRSCRYNHHKATTTQFDSPYLRHIDRLREAQVVTAFIGGSVLFLKLLFEPSTKETS